MDEKRKQELLDRVYRLGYEYEGKYGGCAQCAFAALQAVTGQENDETNAVFKALTALAGGIAGQGDGSCGAYIGATAFIGTMLGRTKDNFADPDRIRDVTARMVDRLHEKFVEKYGTISCHQIHRKLYGRPFYIKDADEFQKFEAAGAHETGCTAVVGDGARWALEVLIDEGLVS